MAQEPAKKNLKSLLLLFITLENSKGLEIQGLRASLVVQTVEHLPAMRETWIWSLGWEDPLKKEMATRSSSLDLENFMDGGAW